ncbi:MAG: 16S rRNA (guanine(527)-N(7))-methyltransferase RsmG [Firmicutes bacterium]|nr:16S rRNA (guanine(527)-N(7))-methyltransferase RsmG [Bacillota bacterium]
MNDNAEMIHYLNQGTEELGFELSTVQIDLFVRYYNALVKSNKNVNLTQITGAKDVALKHFIDSLACASIIEFDKINNFIDIGTGAGFPGIPIKIMYPRLRAVLMDSQQKRVNFLRKVVSDLSLESIEIYHERAELFGRESRRREQYDLCVSRAVAALQVLCELCLPFVKVGGFFVALKGPDIDQEVLEAQNAIKILGGKTTQIIKLNLPISGDGRSIVIMEKIEPTPEKYPRRPGIPAKRPL